MQSMIYHNNCLFCRIELTDETRFREHIIPENIYGFIPSKDICCDCGKIFGDKVDDLAIKQPLIIEALNQLGYPKVTQYEKKLPYFGEDYLDNSKVEMIKKNDTFLIKSIDGKIDDKALPWILQNRLENNNIQLPYNVVSNEIKKFIDNVNNAEPGQIIESEIFNIKVQKKRVKGPFLDKDKIDSISPLIAKVTIFWIYYFIDSAQIFKIRDLQALSDHALLISHLGPIKIFEEFDGTHNSYSKYHTIVFYLYPDCIAIRISLFMRLQWCLFLDLSEPIVMENNGKNIEILGVKLDLENQLPLPPYIQ